MNTPKTDVLLKFIECEWRDIHHSRIQEWSALGVVTGAHVALTQLPRLMTDTRPPLGSATAAAIGLGLAVLFACAGVLLTCRHRRLMEIKLRWIFEAETRLGLVKTKSSRAGVIPASAQMPTAREWRGLSLPRLLSTSGLILIFYALFAIIDITYLVAILMPGSTH